MEIPSKLKNYAYHNLIALDQLFNALTGGAADETLSSRTYRGAILAEQPKKRWRVLYRLINGLFRDKNHCKTAYESEINGKQQDERFSSRINK
jgi:raw score 0.97|nr:DNA helicase UvrD [uncultured Haemophilus sp.]DAK32627.1 MAG TPA: hypothetical protein [Caudoviricetes sp.]DAM75390.1 MAG TPA: hypothetical protein [Caudoviricetes sp.]